jgi:hypothetical protein
MDDQIKQLILSYMEAENKKDHALAEKILYDINKVKALCREDSSD